MEAVILAGGRGTRLASIVKDIPKPMADIEGRPFLEYLLDYLARAAVDRVILSVGFRSEIIVERFGRTFRGIPIDYAIEKEPLGTGGAIRESLKIAQDEHVLIINGDTYFPVDLVEMAVIHKLRGCDLTVAIKLMNNFDRYGTVKCSGERIAGFEEKRLCGTGYINGGVYMMRRGTIANFPDKHQFSFESDFLEPMIDKVNICPFVSDAYFIDIGIPEDYCRAQRELTGKTEET